LLSNLGLGFVGHVRDGMPTGSVSVGLDRRQPFRGTANPSYIRDVGGQTAAARKVV
jgi:hypothetical protein